MPLLLTTPASISIFASRAVAWDVRINAVLRPFIVIFQAKQLLTLSVLNIKLKMFPWALKKL